jgi:hypothetical protein
MCSYVLCFVYIKYVITQILTIFILIIIIILFTEKDKKKWW